MSSKPRLLDLFCGAGGASMGYHRAGFDVVGVDINPQPRYPFEFEQGDVLEWLCEMPSQHRFDAIHASPPCQDYSLALRHLSAPTARLIDVVREGLEASGVPWVIENVPGSPIPRQDTLDGRYGLELCGSMFGLRVRRHRLFESRHPLPAPPRACDHRRHVLNPYNARSRERDGITKGALVAFAAAMEVDWMHGNEVGEAIPPAYTEFIGEGLMTHVGSTYVV